MADEWGAPQTSDTPATASDGVGALLTKLEQVKRELRDLPHGLLKQAGISVTPDGMTIDSELTVTGATRIEGTLSLPAGIVDNDALASPLALDRGAANADGFTVTTTPSDYATFTIPIPDGYSRVLVKAEAMVFVYNASGAGDYLRSRVHVDSPSLASWSRRLLGDLNPASGCSLTVTKQSFFEGLTGGVITVRHELMTDFASMAHASNGATATAAAFFLR